MRRAVVVSLLLSVWPGGGCVTPVEDSPKISSFPVHRFSLPPVRTPRPATVVPKRFAKPIPRRYASAWYPRGRKISPRWTYIVIHHSATATGGAKDFDKYHRETKGWDELGYHFVIGNGSDTPDGFVEVGPRWNKQKHGAHCKTPGNYYNEHGIGICLVGDFTKTRPTSRQLASLYQLTSFLLRETGIPASHIVSHGQITGKTQCPGTNFHLATLRRALQTPTTATVMP